MKLISVIIPCYNVENFIDRCVESLVNQTIGIENIELIFVNDASTDNTYEKLCQWEKKYSDSICVINCEKNGKQGTARNIGLEYANAEYIGFVDSDDWIELDMYEKMYEKAISTGADVVGVLYQREDANGKVYFDGRNYGGKTDTFCEVKKDGDVVMPGGIWSKLYSKKLITESGVYFPENLAYEDNYWGALLEYYIKSYYIISEILYHYFVNENSTVMSKESTRHMDRLMIEKMTLEELKKRGFYEKNKDKIDFRFLRLYYINTLHILFTSRGQLSYDILCMMQDEVCNSVPDFESNPHLNKLNEWEQFFLKTVRMTLSKDAWEDIRLAYLKNLKLNQQLQ